MAEHVLHVWGPRLLPCAVCSPEKHAGSTPEFLAEKPQRKSRRSVEESGCSGQADPGGVKGWPCPWLSWAPSFVFILGLNQ